MRKKPENSLYNILKVDVDVKMDGQLLFLWITSRVEMLRSLGYEAKEVIYRYTNKGMHFWFHLKNHVKPDEVCLLQFLLGDDHYRAYYNFYRVRLGVFKYYNALFSEKVVENE